MRNLVTLSSQHQGVFGFPNCPGESLALCEVMRQLLSIGAYNEVVQSILVQAQVSHCYVNNSHDHHSHQCPIL